MAPPEHKCRVGWRPIGANLKEFQGDLESSLRIRDDAARNMTVPKSTHAAAGAGVFLRGVIEMLPHSRLQVTLETNRSTECRN
jgi:hypothetical protein